MTPIQQAIAILEEDALTNRIERALEVLRGQPQSSKGPVGFMEAMDVVEAGFNTWKGKAHNAKWWRHIDGTPIPNDLMVNIAEAICHSTLTRPDREGK